MNTSRYQKQKVLLATHMYNLYDHPLLFFTGRILFLPSRDNVHHPGLLNHMTADKRQFSAVLQTGLNSWRQIPMERKIYSTALVNNNAHENNLFPTIFTLSYHCRSGRGQRQNNSILIQLLSSEERICWVMEPSLISCSLRQRNNTRG